MGLYTGTAEWSGSFYYGGAHVPMSYIALAIKPKT